MALTIAADKSATFAGNISSSNGSILVTSAITAGATAGIGWNGRSYLASDVDSNIRLHNNAETSFNLLQFGGTTSSFPAIKRESAAIGIRLADDSAYANIRANIITGDSSINAAGILSARTGTAIPANVATTSLISLSSAAGFGFYWGSGAPTVSAAKGSLYLRSDGTGVADRAYINTDGSTTWTAIATAG